jgi:ABC-type transport system substrate-binding protein
VHIDLTEPDATFLPVMTLFFMAPVCPSAGATYSPDWGKRVCGAGPFRLEQWLSSRQIDVVRHPGYFQKGKPYLDRVRFQLLMPALTQRFKFEEAELDQIRDLSVVDSLTYRRDPAWRPFGVWEPAKTTLGTFFNTQMKPFDNVELRRAFAAAVDWPQMAALRPEEILPATQMIPPAISSHDPAFVGQRHDLAAALEHMKNAGYPYDAATKTGGYPLPVRYLVNAESLPSDALGPVIMQQLDRIGIRMEIKSVSWPTYLAESGKRNAAQLGFVSWVMDFPDPSDYFEPTLSSEAIEGEETRNLAFYSNPELDRLLKQAHRELDPALRTSLYRRCEEIVRDEAPWSLGLYQRFYEVVQPYVHGFALDKAHGRDVRWVWLDEQERREAGHSTSAHSVLALIRPWGHPARARGVDGERR